MQFPHMWQNPVWGLSFGLHSHASFLKDIQREVDNTLDVKILDASKYVVFMSCPNDCLTNFCISKPLQIPCLSGRPSDNCFIKEKKKRRLKSTGNVRISHSQNSIFCYAFHHSAVALHTINKTQPLYQFIHPGTTVLSESF